jgi:glyoxylase-like metal-dependent hydrolase (beta-lactamase superfamily II)
MFEGQLPPLLKAALDPVSEARTGALGMGPWDPAWELGEQPHARVRAYPAGKLALFDGARPTGVSIPIVAYVVRVGDLTLTVDSGLSERWRGTTGEPLAEQGPAPGMRYRPLLDGPSFAESLDAEGIRPDRALCTHLHLDHAGGVRALGLPVATSAEELAVALDPAVAGYPRQDLQGLEFAPIVLDRGPVGPFPRHARVAPGLLALDTAGHTPGSISFLACLGTSWALLCGDAVYPVADQPDSAAFLGMLRIRRALAEVGGTLVLPGHDTAVLRACAGGAWLGSDAPAEG